MVFTHSEDQVQFKELLQSFFENECSLEKLKKLVAFNVDSSQTRAAEKFRKELFKQILDLGITSYFLSENNLPGDGFIELAILAVEQGRYLVPVPVSEFILSQIWIQRSGVSLPDYKREAPPICAVAPWILNNSESAESDFRLVAGLDLADFVIAVAAEGEAQIFPLKDRGIQKEPSLDLTLSCYRTSRTQPSFATMSLKGWKNFGAHLSALKALELSGACEKVLEITVSYVKERKQFDVPVGGFQAVQHKLADMKMYSEALRSLAEFAAWAQISSPDQAELAALSAIHYGCMHAPTLVENAIQLLGGIGFTWEHEMHLYLRRVRSICALYSLSESNQNNLLAAAGRS